MSGKDNLIPFNQRSKEEAREYGTKGGKASGRSRRQRASMREALTAILSAPVKDKALRQELKESGAAEMNANSLLALRLYQQAMDGDMRAAKLLFEAIGEADPAGHELAMKKLDIELLRLENAQQDGENDANSAVEDWVKALGIVADDPDVWRAENTEDGSDRHE